MSPQGAAIILQGSKLVAARIPKGRKMRADTKKRAEYEKFFQDL